MSQTITIKDLLKLTEFQTADIIGTQESLIREVSIVTVMDMPHIEDWVKEKELLIVGFYMETIFDASFIEKMAEKQIAGLITKKKFKKNITPELVKVLHFNHIPLLIIEDKFSWSDVMTPIQKLIIDQQTSVLKETREFQKVIFKSLSNEHSFHDLCTALYKIMGISIAILDTNYHLLEYSDDFSWPEFTEHLHLNPPRNWKTLGETSQGHMKDGFIEKQKEWTEQQIQLFILPVYQQKKLVNYLVIKQPLLVNSLAPELLEKIDVFQSVYLLKKAFYDEFQKSSNHYQNLVFEEIMHMKEPNEEEKKQYSLSLGTDLENNYHTLLIKDILNKCHLSFTEKNDLFIRFKAALKEQSFIKPNCLIFTRKKYWVLLIPTPFKYPQNFLTSLNLFMEDFFNHHAFAIGVSNAHPYWQIAAGWQEAKQAVRFIESNHSEERTLLYDNIGILKMFTDEQGNMNHLFINQMLETYITPLKKSDEVNHTELFHTLEIYFDTGFSHIKTSDILYIHKNTLRARLGRIEEILDINLKQTDQLMNLYIALKVSQLIR